MHPELKEDGKDYDSSKKPAPTKRPKAAAARKATRQKELETRDTESLNTPRHHDTANTSLPHACTPHPHLPSPPVIHRGKMSSKDLSGDDARTNKELCMIPKKRCLYSQGQLPTFTCDPGLPPLYPTPPNMYGASLPPLYPPPSSQGGTSYTESDVSVAMILANGFGRKTDDNDESTEPKHKEEV